MNTIPRHSAADSADDPVVSYYRDKMNSIRDKFGPGPRIHFNLGLWDGPSDTSGDISEIRRNIVAAQDRMMRYSAEVWESEAVFSGRLLDIGCGLGGGSIYWAQTCDVDVTAVTNVPEQAALVRELASVAGVASRVETVTSDACTMTAPRPFDAAVAMESLCYMPRDRIFANTASLLFPGGYFAIEEVFTRAPDMKADFDAYWKTRIGSCAEYLEAAEAAGFRLDRNEDVTDRVSEFWVQSLAWSEKQLGRPGVTEDETRRLLRSIRRHAGFFRGWRDGLFETRILRFRKIR